MANSRDRASRSAIDTKKTIEHRGAEIKEEGSF